MNINFIQKKLSQLSLNFIFIVPFVVQLLGVGGLVGYLSLCDGQQTNKSSETPVDNSSESKQTNSKLPLFFLSYLGATAGAIALTIYISRWLSDSMLRLKEATGAIADGKLDQQVEVEGVQEIRILAESYNQMAQQLKASFVYLENINEELELRVEEKSAELLAAQEAVKSTDQNQNKFITNISHQLRSSINEILSYTQTLKNNVAHLDDSQSEHLKTDQLNTLNIVEQDGNHLLSLIDSLLDFSRIESNQIKMQTINLHFPSFLNKLVEMVQVKALAKDIHFQYEPHGALPSTIIADQRRLQQVLLDLLNNAVKITRQGEVTFRVSAVKDIPSKWAEALPQKSIRFEIIATNASASSTSNSPAQSSQDLDLALSQKIVELMGGELNVKTQLDKGSIFWFDSKFFVTDMMLDNKQDIISEALSNQAKKYKVLVVDDIQENRSLLTDMLEPMGFDILTAESGQQGIEIACQTEPDIILTDLFMPGKTGFAMTKELRQMPAFKHTPIIAISASTFEVIDEKSKSAGCDAYLQKPIDQKKLIALLVQYLKLEQSSIPELV